MKKYTLKTIKDTLCYKSNIATIKTIYPDHWHLFAHELMIAANAAMKIKPTCYRWEDLGNIQRALSWSRTPQGFQSWCELYKQIIRRRG